MSNKVSRFRDIEKSISAATSQQVYVTGRLDRKKTHAVVSVLEAQDGEPITLAMSAFPLKGNDRPVQLHGDMHREFPAAYESSEFIIRYLTDPKDEPQGGLMPPPTAGLSLVGLPMS
jgi:hypothetical protein